MEENDNDLMEQERMAMQQLKLLADWNIKHINSDVEQVRKNVSTILRYLPANFKINHL